MCTNTACSTEAKQRPCSEALTSEVGLLQNFRAYKKWIPLSMENKFFLSKESDTKILQCMYFAYEVGIKSALIPIESTHRMDLVIERIPLSSKFWAINSGYVVDNRKR